MSTAAELADLLTANDAHAIDAAKLLGENAWPAIRDSAAASDYRMRRLAMVCAGAVGGPSAASVLSDGLADANVNVRIAAAREISEHPPAGIDPAIAHHLIQSPEDSVRVFLALGAGRLPGERMLGVLRSLDGTGGELKDAVRMALARLGDGQARQAMFRDLRSKSPATRYDVLGQLRYVDDPALAGQVQPLLYDRAVASLVGPERAQRFRRVCDQAVDTLVELMDLQPPFQTSAEKIYSDAELTRLEIMLR